MAADWLVLDCDVKLVDELHCSALASSPVLLKVATAVRGCMN